MKRRAVASVEKKAKKAINNGSDEPKKVSEPEVVQKKEIDPRDVIQEIRANEKKIMENPLSYLELINSLLNQVRSSNAAN